MITITIVPITTKKNNFSIRNLIKVKFQVGPMKTHHSTAMRP